MKRYKFSFSLYSRLIAGRDSTHVCVDGERVCVLYSHISDRDDVVYQLQVVIENATTVLQ
jgi:hypothetical protein